MPGRKRRRGFSGVVVMGGNDDIAQLREDMQKDIDDRIRQIDKEDDDKTQRVTETLKAFSSITAWQVMGQSQNNIAQRLGRLTTFVETSGPNMGRIVIPSTWDNRARQLLGETLEGYIGLSVDTYNAFSADRALTLWGFLLNGLELGGLGDSLFGGILLMQFAANGLMSNPLMPNQPLQNGLVLPRIVAAQIAAIP